MRLILTLPVFLWKAWILYVLVEMKWILGLCYDRFDSAILHSLDEGRTGMPNEKDKCSSHFGAGKHLKEEDKLAACPINTNAESSHLDEPAQN